MLCTYIRIIRIFRSRTQRPLKEDQICRKTPLRSNAASREPKAPSLPPRPEGSGNVSPWSLFLRLNMAYHHYASRLPSHDPAAACKSGTRSFWYCVDLSKEMPSGSSFRISGNMKATCGDCSGKASLAGYTPNITYDNTLTLCQDCAAQATTLHSKTNILYLV